MKKIPVVIPYYRAPLGLEKALASLRLQDGMIGEIFIRDNSEDNILFTRAVNEGLKHFCYLGGVDYVLVMNQDVVLDDGCMKALAETMEKHKNIGILSPISFDNNGNNNWAGSMDAWPYGSCITYQPNEIPDNVYETYWVTGACMLLRAEMVREIGLMDKNMNFICSDSDYSLSARARGYKVCVEPKARFRSQGSYGYCNLKYQPLQ